MLIIEQDRCIQCNACCDECHHGCLTLEGETIKFDSQRCNMCGHCLAVCPRDCIIIDGDGYDCEDVEEFGMAKAANKFQVRNMIMGRRAVRNFTDTDVTNEELEFLLEAGKYAPTGMNRQGNAFVAVRSGMVPELTADVIEAFRRIAAQGNADENTLNFAANIVSKYDQDGADCLFYNAPLVIYVFADSDVEGALAASNIGYMAQSMQLGACFVYSSVHAFDDAEFAAKWKAPEGKKCTIGIIIGNPVSEYFCSVPRKKPIVEIFE